MKKKVLAMFLTGLMTVSALAGCGSKEETKPAAEGATESASEESASEESAQTPADEKITATITVWGPQEDQDDANGNWLKTECEAFAAEHADWDLTFEYGVCSEGDAKTNVATDPTAAADVYMFANDQIPDLLAAGGIAELGGTAVENIKASNSETMVNTVTYDGGVYGVPFTSNTWFMYYDKSVFTEDDVKSLDTMLEKGVVAFPLSNSWYIASFYVGNGCTLFGADGTDEAAGFDFSGDKAVAVTDYLVDLAANPNFRNDADGLGIAGLGDGSVSAIFSGSWDYDAVKEALGDNMGIAAAPTFKVGGTDAQMKAFAGSKAIGVNPNSKNPQVAVALASYLGSADAQKAHLEMRNILPTDSSIDVAGNDLATAVQDVLAKASTVQPLVSTMGQYWTPAQSMGDEIVNGTVTHDNAADKTEAMNTAMNSASVE
ncbi:extracellular solute-binding protein [Butyrivibrio sp. MC2013]|uniref:extracellular solute-binding protein n=1 Tax=Butyrivibrio sp. MC2013 TaxID=1280686 RepID=UPI0004088E5F|nr:extracellular solute-binding protein [Butyrivibrio sp. MC2013]